MSDYTYINPFLETGTASYNGITYTTSSAGTEYQWFDYDVFVTARPSYKDLNWYLEPSLKLNKNTRTI